MTYAYEICYYTESGSYIMNIPWSRLELGQFFATLATVIVITYCFPPLAITWACISSVAGYIASILTTLSVFQIALLCFLWPIFFWILVWPFIHITILKWKRHH